MQVDRKTEKTIIAPFGHRVDKLTGIALGVPRAIRLIPQGTGLRVQIVEDALDHAAVEQQPLYPYPVVGAVLVGRTPIDEEIRAIDGESRFAAH